MSAQFYVPEDFLIAVEEPLVIQEQFVSLNSHVHGKGQLVFNAVQHQYLITQHNIQFPGLVVDKPSQLHIYNAITIHGDFELLAGHVQLYDTLILNGKLIKNELASIGGVDFIRQQTQLKPQHAPLNSNNNSRSFHNTIITFIPAPILHGRPANTPQPAFFYTSTAPHRLAISIPTPPPEYRG